MHLPPRVARLAVVPEKTCRAPDGGVRLWWSGRGGMAARRGGVGATADLNAHEGERGEAGERVGSGSMSRGLYQSRSHTFMYQTPWMARAATEGPKPSSVAMHRKKAGSR